MGRRHGASGKDAGFEEKLRQFHRLLAFRFRFTTSSFLLNSPLLWPTSFRASCLLPPPAPSLSIYLCMYLFSLFFPGFGTKPGDGVTAKWPEVSL